MIYSDDDRRRWDGIDDPIDDSLIPWTDMKEDRQRKAAGDLPPGAGAGWVIALFFLLLVFGIIWAGVSFTFWMLG